ncbi:MAG: Zn-ribbon domain-containing OB-fold protein [Candidatus Bathyarchaeota archaeon]|nr:MAG: Zn-ribbon domain-containing OB-fold protein [Candidatus Bathyarchaeota archaeon]
MATEKITDVRRMLHWPGHMETDYIYTLGLAGEKFFSEIKQNGRLLGAKCKRCRVVYLPPRIYCERCFDKLGEWVNVGTKGSVYTFTMAYVDINGAKLKEPIVYALIKFRDVEGGLVHKLGEVKPPEIRIGMPVEAVFKPQAERKGDINDIKYFKPTE